MKKVKRSRKGNWRAASSKCLKKKFGGLVMIAIAVMMMSLIV